jgi:hypothetical protein
MAIKHGRKGELWIKNSGGTYQNWHQYLNKINHPQTVDNPEFPLFGKDAVQRIVGVEDTKASASGPRDVALETLVYELKGSMRDYKFYPAGSATGESCLAGTILLAGYEPESDASKENAAQVDFEVSDQVTRSIV